jgi:hypothetical protein
MIASCSSNRSNRSATGGSGMPNASCSRSYHPVPMPSSTRPPLISSIWVTATASAPGRRNVDALTIDPSRIRSVSRASPANSVHTSTGLRAVGPATGPPATETK